MSTPPPSDALKALALHYRVHGETMRCQVCGKRQSIMWAHSQFQHAQDCQIADRAERHPWLVLRDALEGVDGRLRPESPES